MRSIRPTTATFALRLLAILALFATFGLSSTAPVAAQGYSAVGIGVLTCDDVNSCWNEIGAQFSVTTEDGEFLGSCTAVGERDTSDYIEGCLVEFPFAATGILVVTEDVSTITPGYAPEENPIFVDTNAPSITRSTPDLVFRNVPASGNVSAAAQTSDIAIVTTENGQSVFDACFVLTTFGNTGCDDNGDGKITFRDVPLGAYTVHQTADLGPGRSVSDFTITVTGAMDSTGWERFGATVVSTGASTGSGRTGITAQESANGGPWIMAIQARTEGAEYPGYTFGAHFTVTSENGDYIDECTLETTDRQVAWWSCSVDVPSDRISLVWEDLDSIPSGYAPVENPITFDPTTYIVGPHGIGANFRNVPVGGNTIETSNSAAATSAGAVDISLLTREPAYGNLLIGACYQLLDYSNIGCDDNGDGQVDFAAIPAGTYTVRQTQTPAGYPTIYDFDIVVGNPYGVPLGYVVNQAREQHMPGARNVSVVLIDSGTSTKVHSSICVQFAGGSDAACDDNNGDGQIDFQGVSLGTYPAKFSGLPAGWQVLTGGGAPTFTVSAGTGPQFIFVEISVPGSAGAGTNSGGSYAGADAGAIAVTGGTSSATSGQTGVPASGFGSSGTTVEIILDTSDSMNEQDQGSQTRIDVAKTVATRLVTETLPAGVPMALRTYSGCTSFLTVPIKSLDPNMVSSTIANLSADGDTPIAQSLRAAGNDLANVNGQKIIVLITDGDETCNGDPKAAIEALVAQDVNVQVNIVGFAIDDASLTATFQDWARAGNGVYYPASNELELHQAVTTASQLSFHVIDPNGSTIANGSVGGSPVAVPPGTYTVEIGTVPVTRYDNIFVTAQQTVTIDLDTGGSAGSTTGIAPASASSGSNGSAASSDRTWTADVWVRLCDVPPNSGNKPHCSGGAGVVVNISLASGEFLGSCTTSSPYITPGGYTISTCMVPGLPFNANFIATQEPSTIPAGYEPASNTVTFSVGNERQSMQFPQDVDGRLPDVDFINVPVGVGPSSPSNSNSSTGATLLMTFRGCPEGFDPATDDPYANCTIPLDAPDAAYISWGEGGSALPIAGLQRQYNGAYIFEASPYMMSVVLSGLAPVVRDTYGVIGSDSSNGYDYYIGLHDGETREVLIYYYFY